MHIPSIVLAQHEREARHTFARADHGFAYMGIMRKFNAGRLRKVFVELIDEPERRNVLISTPIPHPFREEQSQGRQRHFEALEERKRKLKTERRKRARGGTNGLSRHC